MLLRHPKRQDWKVVEFFVEREAPAAMIGEDEPDFAADLRAKAMEIG